MGAIVGDFARAIAAPADSWAIRGQFRERACDLVAVYDRQDIAGGQLAGEDHPDVHRILER